MFPGFFTRPTGDLGLQLSPRADHVETNRPRVTPEILAGANRRATGPSMANLIPETFLGIHPAHDHRPLPPRPGRTYPSWRRPARGLAAHLRPDRRRARR